MPRKSANQTRRTLKAIAMPSPEVESYGIPAVAAFKDLLDELLQQARTVKPSSSVDPALKKSDFEDIQTRIWEVFRTVEQSAGEESSDKENKARRFAIIETAARDTLSALIVSRQRVHAQHCSTLTSVGYHVYRISGFRQGLEFPRYTVNPLRWWALRTSAIVLACRGAS